MTYPLSTLAPTISSTGITIPSYNDIYQSLIAIMQGIYGSDIYVDPDSQDGQWLAALAQAINNSNQAAVAVYQAYSPTYAQGTGLDSVIKINGLKRDVATNSQAVGNIIGVAGTIITNGVVMDTSSNLWNLPTTVIIPGGGSIEETVTAQSPGSISAGIGQINAIYTPQLGWQSFSNTSAATQGNPVEADGQLRVRQSQSTALPAQSIKEAIYGALSNIPGVTRVTVYENDTGATDANGVSDHTFIPIVQGGDANAIANAIYILKPPGIQTGGTTTIVITDQLGLVTPINFDVLTLVPIYYAVTIKALAGYVSTTGDALIAALVAFTNALGIGDDVYQSQVAAVASLGGALGATFYIVDFYLDITAVPVSTANIAIAYNAAASGLTANTGLTVT
jgi:uncharacterized phage protein gp47/JayE